MNTPHNNTIDFRIRRGQRRFMLLRELKLSRDRRVPARFTTDFASVPRLLRPFVIDETCTAAPAARHDYHYRILRWNRREADREFYTDLREWGVGRFTAMKYWLAVRAFGWLHWL